MNINTLVKTFILALVIFFSLSCNDGATTESLTVDQSNTNGLSAGLIAQYSFENNANDTSGNGKNGTLQGTYSFVNGKEGKCIRLIGDNATYHTTGGFVVIPQIDTTNLQGLTISIWVKEDSLSVGDGYVFLSSQYEYGWCGIGHFGQYVQFAVGSNGVMPPLSIAFDSTAFGSWTLYTLIYSNNMLSAYINGQLKGELSQKLSIYGNLATIGSHIWGGFYTGYSTHFTGDIDELRIYSRALTRDEVQGLYRLGL
jgi:hypothetical protein